MSQSATAALASPSTFAAETLLAGRVNASGLNGLSEFEACLIPFLNAAGWAGEPRHLIESLPHFDPVGDLLSFRIALSNLGVSTVVEHQRLDQLPNDQFPCLILHDGRPQVVIRRLASGKYQFFSGKTGESAARRAPAQRLQVCKVIDAEAEEKEQARKVGWFRSAIGKFRAEIGAAVALTCLINIISLATPLLSMAVYNNIAPAEAADTLYFLVVGALLGLSYDNYLRWRRSRLISRFAARLNATIQRDAFARLLMLPLSMTESASVSVQSARLKQFENILGVFSGSLATAMLDAPFTLLFLVVIGVLGGGLFLVPVALAVTFGLLAALLMPLARTYTREAGRRRILTQDLLRQSIWERETICGLGAERLWTNRVGAALRRGATARFQAASLDQLLHSISQLLTSLAGVITLFIGSLMVIEGTLSIGALIAVMMVVWRVLAPIQTIFLTSNQLINARDAVRQIDGLMQLPTDRAYDRAPSLFRQFRGEVRVEGMSFRYPKAADWSLRGVSFKAPPGELIGVAGAVGCGKSTLLRLLLGLHKPAAGAVFLDGMNLSQLDPGEVRATVGYSPERPKLFFGTVAQNIRLAHPAATLEEIEAVLAALNLALDSPSLPDGLDTRLSSTQLARLTESAIQRIALARALVKPAPILLLDEPGALLSPEENEALIRVLEGRRGRSTTFLASSNRAQLARCDKLLLLHQGQVAAFDAPGPILEKFGA